MNGRKEVGRLVSRLPTSSFIYELVDSPTDGTIRTTPSRGYVHGPTGTYLHNSLPPWQSKALRARLDWLPH